jgi:hypothetical protein
VAFSLSWRTKVQFVPIARNRLIARTIGIADLPLPKWLADRMRRPGAAISEAILYRSVRDALVRPAL